MNLDAGTPGRILLYFAFAGAVWGAVASGWSLRRRNRGLAASGGRSLHATTLATVACVALLLIELMSRNFSLQYVVNYTSLSTPRLYAFTSLWAGMEGSLLFWTMITAAYASTAVWVQRKRRPDLTPAATCILSGLMAFYLGVLAFASNPFDVVSPVPPDGFGLNPLLQSPFMAIHPVMLYLGLTGFAVPFAFAASSLVSGRLDTGWFTSTRRWTVLAWGFLTAGIVLGSAWAYSELGWGGFWAWDPVENASLLPWLTATAFLHSVMVQERRGMLKIWNVGLILGTYCLAVFGTFLTRSGLLNSVHTFSESPIGQAFLPFLAVLLVAAAALLAWRFDRLRSDRSLDSMLSREAMFLFNNVALVTIALTVIWGTLYPVIVEAWAGTRVSVGPAFYNSVVAPLGLALLALTGVGPLIAWRKASPRNLRRQFSGPLVAGAITIGGLAAAGVRSAGALLALGLCVFVAAATIGEFVQGARAHRAGKGLILGLVEVVSRNRRRFGGYIVHLGVVLIFVGLSGLAFRQTWTGTMQPGDSFRIGGYEVAYASSRSFATEEKMVNMAVMEVSRGSRPLGTLRPQRNFHLAQRQPQSEVAIRSNLADDLYLVLIQMQPGSEITLRAWLNPLTAWLWIGGAVMALGTLVVLSAKPAVLPHRTAPEEPKAQRPQSEKAEALL